MILTNEQYDPAKMREYNERSNPVCTCGRECRSFRLDDNTIGYYCRECDGLAIVPHEIRDMERVDVVQGALFRGSVCS